MIELSCCVTAIATQMTCKAVVNLKLKLLTYIMSLNHFWELNKYFSLMINRTKKQLEVHFLQEDEIRFSVFSVNTSEAYKPHYSVAVTETSILFLSKTHVFIYIAEKIVCFQNLIHKETEWIYNNLRHLRTCEREPKVDTHLPMNYRLFCLEWSRCGKVLPCTINSCTKLENILIKWRITTVVVV